MKKRALTLLIATLAVLFMVVSIQPAWAGSDAAKSKMTTEKATQAVKAQKININTADEGALANLNGVGPKLAQRIIDYRSKSGKFKNIEELKNVQGIGEKIYSKIAPLITVK